MEKDTSIKLQQITEDCFLCKRCKTLLKDDSGRIPQLSRLGCPTCDFNPEEGHWWRKKTIVQGESFLQFVKLLTEPVNRQNGEQEGEDLGYWNSDTFELFAERTPDECPNCGRNSNFTLVKKKPEGMTQVTDLYYLKHECGWEKDITPWELA